MNRREQTNLKQVGFWTQTHEDPATPTLSWPGNLVDPTWDKAERDRVVAYLKAGKEGTTYRGMSMCRLCPGDKWNGSSDLHDDVYLWPDGFAHYLEEHDVKPPQEFVNHVLSRPKPASEPFPEMREELKRIQKRIQGTARAVRGRRET